MSARGRAFALACTLASLGCDSTKSFEPSGVHAAASSSIATLVDVQWATDEATVGYVSYGTTPDLGQVTPVETAKATTHSLSVLGLAPTTKYYYRVVIWDGANAGASPIDTLTTGALPSDLPVLTATGDMSADTGFSEFLLLPIVTQKPTVSILGPDGKLLWYYVESKGRTVTRTRFSADEKAVLYNAIGDGTTTTSEIVRVSLDGTQVTSVPVPGLGRDFVELANGHYAALVSDTRPAGSGMLRGDKLVEVDANGNATPIVSFWDCFDPTANPGDGTNGEWTGATALGFSDSADTDLTNDIFYVSLRDLSSVVRVARSTGKCDWIVGAAKPTLAFASGSSPFIHPGGVYASSSKLLVLDTDGAGTTTSRVVEYALDTTALTATQSFTYAPNPPLHVDMGTLSSLTGERRLVNWGSAGKLELVNASGAPVWSLQAPAGVSFGYHVRTASIYQPANEP